MPYHKTRYHPSNFHGANPRGPREIFNQVHSSLRGCIEREVWRFKGTIKDISEITKIFAARLKRAFELHNYFRRSKVPDPTFRIIDEDLNFIPPEVFSDAECNFMQEVQRMSTNKMKKVHNDITTNLMGARRPRQRCHVLDHLFYLFE